MAPCEVARAEAVRLGEKLKASQAEVVCLQVPFQEGDVQSLVVTKYLRSDVHRRREEFERSQYSQSGYRVVDGSSGGDLAQARFVVDLFELCTK
ncbi:hypothetical protein ACLOJK_013125 [Asimina triloba]